MYQPGSGAALWKGKARAVEPPMLGRASYDAGRSQTPHLDYGYLDQTSASDEASSPPESADVSLGGLASSSDTESSPAVAAQAFLRVMEDAIKPIDEDKESAIIDDLRRKALQLSSEHSRCFSYHHTSILKGINPVMDDITSVLPKLAAVYLDVMQSQRMTNTQRRKYRSWMSAAIEFMQDRPAAIDALAMASVEAFARRGNDRLVCTIAQQVAKQSGRWHPELLERYINARLSLDEPHILPNPKDLPLDLPLHTQNLLITAHLQARNMSAARKVFRLLQQRTARLDTSTLSAVLKGYRAIGASHNLYRALAGTVRDLHLAHDTETVNLLIECCLSAGDLRSAHELYQQFEEPFWADESRADALPAPVLFDQVPLAPPIAAETLALPTAPTAIAAFPATVSAAEERHETQVALTQIVNEKDTGLVPQIIYPRLPPNKHTFELFVRGYIASGDLDKALDAMTRMMDDGYRPRPLLSRALRQAYAQQGKPGVAREHADLLEHVLAHNLNLSADRDGDSADMREKRQRHLASLKAGLDSDNLDAVPAIIDQMTQEGISVTSRALTWLVAYAARHSGFSKASTLLEILDKSDNSSPTLSEFNIMLNAAVREEQGQSVLRNLSKGHQSMLDGRGLGSGTGKTGGNFACMLRQLRQSGLQPDSYTVAILMRRFAAKAGSPRALWQFFQRQILNRGLQPAPQHILALMVGYCKCNDPYGARRAMDRGEVLGVRPNVQLYSALISYYTHAGKPDIANTIYQEMRSRRIKPDLGVYITLAHAAAMQSLTKRVFDLARQYRRDYPEAVWPEPGLVSCIYRCRNRRREYTLAQNSLASALDGGLVPDAILYRLVWRTVKDHQVNCNRVRAQMDKGVKADEALAKREQALALAKANLKRMREVMKEQKAGSEALAPENNLEEALRAALEAIARNRSHLGMAQDAEPEPGSDEL